MPPVTTADPVAKVRFIFVSSVEGDGAAVNVMHFHRTGGGGDLTVAELTNLGSELEGWVNGTGLFTTAYTDCFVSDYAVSKLEVRSIQTGNDIGVDIAVGDSGNIIADTLPRDVALVATLRTGFTGRNKRGRVYVPGQPESENDNGVCTATHAATVRDAFQVLIDELPGVTTAAWELVVWSPTYGIHTPVLTATTDTRWDTQRRRDV